MTNYKFLSTDIWDMFLQMHNLIVNNEGSSLFILDRKTKKSLWLNFAVEQHEELHPFDLLVELADRLHWSSETIDQVEEHFGVEMINDLIGLVEDIENAQLA